MSKLVKLLSIGCDILAGMRLSSEEEVINAEYNVERICNLVQWLEAYCNHNGFYYAPKWHSQETGLAQISVIDETGKGVPAQVKFFPLETNISAGKEVDFIREITEWDGRLAIRLPDGDYRVEISKGSEYELCNLSLHIAEKRTTRLKIELIPILNLRMEGWYSGDLHHHSIFSSPVYGGTDPVIESPELVCRSLAAMGASFGALSDHHNILNHQQWKALKSDSFIPVISKEISTTNGHVMALGVEKDIIYQIPEKEKRTDTNLRAEFIRITDDIKRLGGLPQINHPKDHSRSISWNEDFNDIIDIFETMEIWNGSNPMIQGTTNHKAFLLWLRLLEEGNYIPATSGSDTHNILANDYHKYINKLSWMAQLIKSGCLALPKEIVREMDTYFAAFQKLIPVITKWAENLTSAGVRTYVHINGEVTQQSILLSLKQGHSFLTNGPVLIPEIDGKLPGEIVSSRLDKININIKLYANRPLRKLFLYFSGNRRKEYMLEPINYVNGKYDYSRTLSGIDINGVKWIFFIAEDDCTNMAITNPIFIE